MPPSRLLHESVSNVALTNSYSLNFQCVFMFTVSQMIYVNGLRSQCVNGNTHRLQRKMKFKVNQEVVCVVALGKTTVFNSCFVAKRFIRILLTLNWFSFIKVDSNFTKYSKTSQKTSQHVKEYEPSSNLTTKWSNFYYLSLSHILLLLERMRTVSLPWQDSYVFSKL